MKKIYITLLLLTLIFCWVSNSQAGYDVYKLADAINPFYPLWKINKDRTKEEYGFLLLFNNQNPREIEIPKFKEVLNGRSHTLLSCYGQIIPPERNGYIVGTAVEGPTFGRIIIFDDTFKKIADIDAQKVVKIKLINLLNEGALQIITWEDHHFGTNTTRRVLNIYMIYRSQAIKKIFSHDIVDATFISGGKEVHYSIDYYSLIRKKQIIVINEDNGHKEVCTWNGVFYTGENCQQQDPSAVY